MDDWKKKKTSYKVLRKLADSFFFSLFALFLCPPHFFSSPFFCLWLQTRLWLEQQLGSISIHFQGAATAVRECVRVEKEWGCVCERGMVREVWTELSQIWQWKNNQHYETSLGEPMSSFTVFFWGVVRDWSWHIFYVFVCSSSCFLFLFAASWGESSVFINREDTSISVAVMHTGWALMKTDALSVKTEARGDSNQPSLLLRLARGALMITRWDLFI